MQRKTLGNTGMEVAVLGYGAMALSSNPIPAGRKDSSNEASVLLNRLLDSGVNLIDTSPDYGNSEQIIGQAISHRREEYYLATKCGCNIPMPENCNPDHSHVWTKEQLLKNIELSLKRMKTEYVDIWQLHNPSPEEIRRADLIGVMEQVKQQGKVRHISISACLPEIKTYIGWNVFATFQIPYSALQRQHEKAITVAAEFGAGTIIRGAVAGGERQGILSPRWQGWQEANLDELRGQGESRSAFMLRFTISHPHLHTTIVGTRNMQHLQENLKTIEIGPLVSDVYAEAKRRLEMIGKTSESLK